MALKLVKDLDQAWILWHAGLLVDKRGDPWYPPTGYYWSEFPDEESVRKCFDTAVGNALYKGKCRDEHCDNVLTWFPYISVEDDG